MIPAPASAPPSLWGDGPEREHAASSDPDHRRRFSQWFTPFGAASFMARWVLDAPARGPRPLRLLDPAMGLGVFARAAASLSRAPLRMAGYEIDPLLADKAEALLAGLPERLALDLRRRDFLACDWEERWDGILCNPPYLRFQEQDGRAERFKVLEERMGVRPKGAANLHCLFLLKAVHQLSEGGRAAFLMPWEFLNAGYGETVKAHLLASGVLRHAVVFDSAKGVFPGAVTTAGVLLLERDGPAREVAFHRASPAEDLEAFYRARIAPGPGAGEPTGTGTTVMAASDLDAGAKWRGYWQGTSHAKYGKAVPMGSFAQVLRGIATGSNGFFLLDEAAREAAGLPEESLLPCVAKARDAEGPFFSRAHFDALRARGRKAWLLDAGGREGHPAVAAYLEEGLRAGADKRFLTRHRNPWYALEKRPPAPLWVPVFLRGALKPVLNRAGVRNLTAFHCVYPREGCAPLLDLLFAWLLTDEAARLARAGGREMGEGLLKLEPMDWAEVPVPDFTKVGGKDTDALRDIVRCLEENAIGRQASLAPISEIFRTYF